jgi:hypothetical protein
VISANRFSPSVSVNSVATRPGATALTVMFFAATSRARVRVKPITPALAAE